MTISLHFDTVFHVPDASGISRMPGQDQLGTVKSEVPPATPGADRRQGCRGAPDMTRQVGVSGGHLDAGWGLDACWHQDAGLHVRLDGCVKSQQLSQSRRLNKSGR
jgi:hypothetical protein